MSLPDRFTTGSSIMPQKKNYDIFEIMRANSKAVLGKLVEINSIISGLGSGYHRDLQLTKKMVVEGTTICLDSFSVMKEAIPHLRFNAKILQQAMTEDLFVTDEVYRRVAQGTPFRTAYSEVKVKRMKDMAEHASQPY
eukprot:GHVN01008011.1.p1 GENE.GHVN01008011.1~~GHVN01008011.1.p1  ORF type:complete len:138 (+),score=19.32 GHVN01008011.1:485-898(+)